MATKRRRVNKTKRRSTKRGGVDFMRKYHNASRRFGVAFGMKNKGNYISKRMLSFKEVSKLYYVIESQYRISTMPEYNTLGDEDIQDKINKFRSLSYEKLLDPSIYDGIPSSRLKQMLDDINDYANVKKHVDKGNDDSKNYELQEIYTKMGVVRQESNNQNYKTRKNYLDH